MDNSRRTFLKNSTLALAGLSFSNELLTGHKAGKKTLGLQLYSVRDDMKQDPLATLKQLAKIGYKYVEHANYADRKFYGYAAVEFKKVLDDLGLKMPSGHTKMGAEDWDSTTNDFTDKWKQTVDDAATAGQMYVISPWLDEDLRKDLDGVKKFMDVFNKCGELCKKSGLKFGYHNHNFEFDSKLDGVLLYDIILKYTDPALVAQQLDIGNMYGAGGRALEILKKYPGRFQSLHVKDEIPAQKGEMGDGFESTVLGKGLIPVKQVVDLAEKSGGTSLFIVEQESYQSKTPLACVKEDLEIMQRWGY